MSQATYVSWHFGEQDTVSVSHVNHIIRYFNGRRYHTVQNRTSFHIPATFTQRELNWTSVHHYVSVAGRKMSYRYSPARFSATPVDEIRTMFDMIPGDMQEVPF